MEPEEVKKLIHEWTSKPQSHDEFRKDPVKYVEKWGYELDDMTKSKLAAWHDLPDSEIEERISKRRC